MTHFVKIEINLQHPITAPVKGETINLLNIRHRKTHFFTKNSVVKHMQTVDCQRCVKNYIRDCMVKTIWKQAAC